MSIEFDTDDRNMLDDWLVVGSADGLRSGSAASPWRRTLLGRSLILWRDAAGSVQGTCGGVPLCVQERYRYLWVCPSGRPARPLFSFPEFDESGRRIVDCGGIGVRASGLRIVENFLDMAHFPFVHPGSLGAVPHTEVADYQVDVDPDNHEIWATECCFQQPRASASANDGILAHYRYRVMQPLTTMLYKSCVPRPDRLDAIGLFVQPVNENHSIAHCLLVYFDDTSSDAELIAFQQAIFAQDKPVLENHALPGLPLHGRVETATRADLASVRYRQWLRQRGCRFGTWRG